MTPAQSLYRRLLQVLPHSFRTDAEAELLEVFDDGHARVAQASFGRRVRFWLVMVLDVAVTAVAEWRAVWQARGKTRAAERPRHNGVGLMKQLGWAFRHLLRRPGRSAVSAITLALGIATTVVGIVLVRGVLLSPLPFPEAENLVRLRELDDNGRIYWPSFPNIADWRAEGGHIFEAVGAVDVPEPRPVLWNGQAQRLTVGGYARGTLEMLRVRPAIGRDFTAEENAPGGAPVAVVSWPMWQTHLGARPLDQLTLTIGAEQYQVVGVLPADFRFFGEAAQWSIGDVFLPMERRELGGRQSHGYHTVARLRDGVTYEMAQPMMNALAQQLRETHREETQAQTIAMTRVFDDVVGHVRDPLRLLIVAAVLVLLIACMNVGGTLLAEGIGRDRELAVRLAMGARRRDLLGQLIAESAALAVPGALLGALLATGTLYWLRQLQSHALPRLDSVSIDATTLVITFTVAIIAALVAGVVPAAILSARDLGSRLRGSMGLTSARGTTRLWSGFIAAQTALTLVLLFGGALLLRSLIATLSMPLGFDADDVLVVSISLPESRYEAPELRPPFYTALLEQVRVLPGVDAAGISTKLPHDVTNRTASSGHADATEMTYAAYRIVDPGYFAAVRVPAVRGQAPADGASVSEAWIDESFARYLEQRGGSAVGALVTNNFQDADMRVLGTVGEVRDWSMDEGMPTVYVDYRTAERVEHLMEMNLLVRVRGDMSGVAQDVQAIIARIDPMVPHVATPMQDVLAGEVADRRLMLGLIGGFAAIALCLAAVAMYSMVSFVVGRRRREMGIRVSLGARPAQVIRQTMRNGVVPAAAGLVAGFVAALMLGSLLESQLFNVPPRDPIALGVATALLAFTALVASAIPARTAARVDPVSVLRTE